MEHTPKEQILGDARSHLAATIVRVGEEIVAIEDSIARGEIEVKTSEVETEETKMVQQALIEHSRGRLEELARMQPSPYFTRCDVTFDDEGKQETVYVGRFSFNDEHIYSWTTGIAALRFEDPGAVAYETPEDGARTGTLQRKDQYMIVDGKIIFLSSEGIGAPRQLIHQEYLSARKNTFALPEIVAQMEKAQDQVIRAHHAGPFVISGPAGSGKTTLALHRVAYLTQSPDTAKQYPSRRSIVFVQDSGTKDYFSHLLPELGIHDVVITTFPEWALSMLEITNASTVLRPGASEPERDAYEYAKIQALRAAPVPLFRRGNFFGLLENFYVGHLNSRQKEIFAQQKTQNAFDRYDLTVLLMSLSRREDGFTRTRMITSLIKDGTGRTKNTAQKEKIEYPLMVVDEFQNYLPEQLRLFGMCLKRSRSVLYVGDMAQQTRFGTLREWAEIGEALSPERTVTLHKVYRNTRNILEYIRSLGYSVEIPDGIKTGSDVTERTVSGATEEISYIVGLLNEDPERSIGVLAFNPDYLAAFVEHFGGDARVRCMSVREAQGVEFDSVCLVGISADLFAVEGDEVFAKEKQRVDRDLLYVALTRAISELHVLGSSLGVLRA